MSIEHALVLCETTLGSAASPGRDWARRWGEKGQQRRPRHQVRRWRRRYEDGYGYCDGLIASEGRQLGKL